MRGGNGICSRFLIIIGDENKASTKEAAKQLCETLGGFVELRLSRHRGIELIRPDGDIALSAHNGDSIAALGSVRSLLDRQAI
jgi:hypothetical protein